MGRLNNVRLSRRDMLKLSAGGAGMFALTASGFAVPRGFAGGGGGGSVFIEAFPTSPLILDAFADTPANQLNIPQALRPMSDADMNALDHHPLDPECQDVFAARAGGPLTKGTYVDRYGEQLGRHQCFPVRDRFVAPGPDGTPGAGTYQWKNTTPLVYQIKLQVNTHDFTKSKVLPIDSFGKPVKPQKVSLNADGTTYLPSSTIYGFNGTFPGPRINAEYGRASIVRFENHLGENPLNLDRQDFGAPNYGFLTHLHNGHTAPESDGQPHYSWHRFTDCGDSSRADDINIREQHYRASWEPGEWVNQCYLGYPAGGDSREIQSFFWFHDHVHGHTGANVYKGMVGLMPIYDPDMDNGDERTGYRLPGVRRDNGDGTFNVDYDIPLALYDCRLDDGVTPHKDAHNGNGETHPEWWGKTYFRHLPNHGFVGDIFTVNGTAYPTLRVKRRKYRLRFLDASISRIYNLKLMTSSKGPIAAKDLGYTGDELQGQYRLPDGQQCMQFVQVANEGGLLPNPIVRDDFELWPAKRKEVVVDFTKWIDGSPTPSSRESVLYLVDTMKMTTGRMWDSPDPAYKVPLMKIIIEADDPKNPVVDNSKILPALRPNQPLVGTPAQAMAAIKDNSIPTFELERGSAAGDPETEWLINGLPFDPTKPLISPKKDSGAFWRIRNGGGGWVHPMHLHMEEHTMVGRGGKPDLILGGTDARHPDDTAKEDVVALDPSEETVISRRFRTFCGPYVAHCHNLAHEDHNMMFGWEIVP
jgi:FtsP/CotA-like multicopper oxidase with cupredoxin domain